jgi:hypothetical protein
MRFGERRYLFGQLSQREIKARVKAISEEDDRLTAFRIRTF